MLNYNSNSLIKSEKIVYISLVVLKIGSTTHNIHSIVLSSSPATTLIHRQHQNTSYQLDKIDSCHTKHRYMLVKVTQHTQHIPDTHEYTYLPLHQAVLFDSIHSHTSYALDQTDACHTKHRYMLVEVTHHTQHIPDTHEYTYQPLHNAVLFASVGVGQAAWDSATRLRRASIA